MIHHLEIHNFKSIKDLKLSCKKVNVFIGEPNAGKTNVIEALAFTAFDAPIYLKDLVRFESVSNLFHDESDSCDVVLNTNTYRLLFKGATFEFTRSNSKEEVVFVKVTYDGTGDFHRRNINNLKFFKYERTKSQNNPQPGSLIPPYGENLFSTIISNSSLKELVLDIFKSKGFKLQIKPIEREISLFKQKGDEIFSYSFPLISETLRRIIFLMACLETSRESVLLFDEPEANLFPFYTKYFAERLAYDETNQFFFTTHNPYLMEALVAKTKPEDLNVVVTYMDNYETKIRVLKEGEILEYIGSDIFFNLKSFTEPA